MQRTQFSLQTLALLTAIIALGVTVGMMYRELGPLREEVRRLRIEAGVLDITDASRVHAVRVETYQRKAWKWRVWCPEGRRVFVKVSTANIPKQTSGTQQKLPVTHGWLELNRHSLEGAEAEVSLALDRDLDGTVHVILREGRAIKFVQVPENARGWLRRGSPCTYSFPALSRTITSVPDQPLELLKIIAVSGSTATSSAGVDGIMAWVMTTSEF